MPGRPKLRALTAAIEANGGFHDYLLAKIGDGVMLKTLCEELGVSRRLIHEYVGAQQNGREAYRHARNLAAEALADESYEIAQRSTNATERVDALRINTNKWLAKCADPDTYGDTKPAVQVNITAGSLHLDALRKITAERQATLPAHDSRLTLPSATADSALVTQGEVRPVSPVLEAEYVESTG